MKKSPTAPAEKASDTMRALMKSARESAVFRGHHLSPWRMEQGCTLAIAQCEDCKKHVQVNEYPAPNGIDISGEAVADGCEPEQDRKIQWLEACTYDNFEGSFAEFKEGMKTEEQELLTESRA